MGFVSGSRPGPRETIVGMRRRSLAGGLVVVACAASRGPATRSTEEITGASEPAAAWKQHATTGQADAASRLDATDHFGEGYPRSSLRAPGTGVGSLGYGTWIQPKPRSGTLPLGSIRVGGSIPLLDREPVRGDGKCPRFVRVEHGFVCAGRRATLDMHSPWM